MQGDLIVTPERRRDRQGQQALVNRGAGGFQRMPIAPAPGCDGTIPARERDQRQNALEDELAALEKEIAATRESFERESSAKESDLERREAEVVKGEVELERLRDEVAAFPARLDEEVKNTISETTQHLQSEAEARQSLIRAQFEGEKNVLLSKIDALESRVSFQQDQLNALADKQEKAYENVQEIANRAVEGARREIITVPTQSSKGEERD